MESIVSDHLENSEFLCCAHFSSSESSSLFEIRHSNDPNTPRGVYPLGASAPYFELELELIQTQMAQKPMLRAEVGMRVRCANKASAE